MKKRLYVQLLSVWLCCFTLPAKALLPSSETAQYTATYDLSSPPDTLYMWSAMQKGTAPDALYLAMVCESSLVTAHGQCPDTAIWQGTGYSAPIALQFVQDKTNVRRDISLTSLRNSVASGGNLVWTGANVPAGNNAPSFSYSIKRAELARLTVGTWRATLKMNYQLNKGDGKVTKLGTTWTANIILNVIDLSGQQIFFPAFPNAAPRVDLNLNNRHATNATTTRGSASLDMCLYDGSNSVSNRLNLLIRDEGASAPGRSAGSFSVYLSGAIKSRVANRIDYTVSILNPTTGVYEAVKNGTRISWVNTNQRSRLRQVVIPGVAGVSLCVPAPLRFDTPAFRLADKAAGHYSGRLTLIYTPSTQNSGDE